MSNKFEVAADRLSQKVPAAEACLDDALISLSSLITTLVQVRKATGVAPSTGQGTIFRLTKAQMALVTVSNDVLRAHKDLSDLADVHAGMDLHECPKAEAQVSTITKLALAS